MHIETPLWDPCSIFLRIFRASYNFVVWVWPVFSHIVPTTSVAAKANADTSVAADNTIYIAPLVA